MRPDSDDQAQLATTALVLAGGRAQRMGGEDKGLIEVFGRAMVAWVVEALAPQCALVLVNANRNQVEYERITGRRVLPDALGDFAGPLAGMASGLAACQTQYLVTAPCDSPLVAADLVSRLHGALVREDADLAVAHDGERIQPVFALLKCELKPRLEAFLEAGGRKIDLWYATEQMALADFSDRGTMFMNINTPEDRDALEALLEANTA